MKTINNYFKKSLPICILLLISLLLVSSVGAQEKEARDSQELNLSSDTSSINLDNFSGEIIVYDIIEFVISRDRAIKTKKDVINAIEDFDLNEGTEESSEDELPKYIQSNLQEKKLETLSRKQQVQEEYTALKRELVSQLMKKLSDIFSYKNQAINQQELYQLLLAREENIKRQVEAGIMEPKDLQDLSERINQVQTSIADARLNMKMFKMEIAFNYGGDEWEQLLKLIDKLEASIYQ